MTKQEYLAMSLPYELKCQYKGIISFERQLINIGNVELNPHVNYEYGNKIGLLKQVHIFKKYWIARCGIKHTGLKVFYNGEGLYPILHPLTDLVKPITQKDYNNGEPFVPIVELQWNSFDQILKRGECSDVSFVYIQKLLKWHFDIIGLIAKGEAIDINALDVNPYR